MSMGAAAGGGGGGRRRRGRGSRGWSRNRGRGRGRDGNGGSRRCARELRHSRRGGGSSRATWSTQLSVNLCLPLLDMTMPVQIVCRELHMAHRTRETLDSPNRYQNTPVLHIGLVLILEMDISCLSGLEAFFTAISPTCKSKESFRISQYPIEELKVDSLLTSAHSCQNVLF